VQLRPYQIQTCESVRSGWEQFGRQLAVLPTGAGKTIIAANISKHEVGSGNRVLFLAHREELLVQTLDKFQRAAQLSAELEKAEHRASLGASIVVGSVQTFSARGDRWPEDHFDLVIVDEAHHTLADSYRKVLARFDGHANVLGITASPDRGDKKNLGEYFESVAYEIGLFDLINQGYLSPITVKSVPLSIDLSGVRSVAGDFADADLGCALEPYLPAIATAIREHAAFRRTLVFLPLIATSEKFVEACRKVGLRAEHVDGYSDDRAQKLGRFARWDFDVLGNAMLLTEGYDDPGIDCVVVLRPTRSRALYSQMVGRGTRVQDDKENLLLLDFLWNHSRLSLVRPAHLIAKSDEEAEQITQLAQDTKPGGEQQELDLQDLANSAAAQREATLAKRLAEHKDKKAKHLSAEEFALLHHRLDTAEYEPTMRWECEPITEKQAKYLRQAGIDLATVSGKGHASKLLDIHFGSKKLTLATQAQRAFMRRNGHPSPDSATADEARKFFAGLRKKAA
jgi:superfamily II DNA or RNA helicase